MKLTLPFLLSILLTAFVYSDSNAQTVTSNNESWATLVAGGACNSCTITIPAGWTLLLNSNGTCNGCTFNGGTVNITSGFSFGNTTTYNNDTLLINKSTNPNNFVFNSDSVAVNFPLSNQNGTDIVSNCRLSVNAGLSFQSATLTNDSIHLNNTMSFSNSPATFSGCNVTVADNAKITTQGSTFTHSVFAFAGNATLNTSNAMTADGSSFYLHGSSSLKASTITLQDNSNIVMDGSNSFQSSNALTLQNSNITMSSTATLSASSLNATDGAITANGNTKVTISNAINLTGVQVTMNDASTFKGSTATVQTGSDLTMNGSATLTVSNAFDVSGSSVSMNGTSGVTANSSTVQSSTLTMNGSAALSVTNTVDVNAGNVSLNGNSAISDNATTIENNSSFVIGDGTLASTAHLSTSNTVRVLDNSLLKVSNGNNYLLTNANSFTGGSTSYPIKTNTISCNPGTTNLGYANSCSTGYVYGCATLNSGGAVACTILAISGVDLSAAVTGADAVALAWSDADNANVDHFQVQRSTNGQDWTTIGNVTANAYSTEDYHFNDPAASAGTNNYRLLVADKDGHSLYSRISTVTIASIPASISVYPNPATGHTFFVRTASTGPLLVNVFTLSGQLLFRTSLKGQTQYPVRLPASVLSGNYMVVQVISNEGTQAFNVLNQ